MTATKASRLCDFCEQIPYPALECPSFRDLANEAYRSERERFIWVGPYLPPTSCGTLARIYQSASDCALCKLIWSIIVRDNGGEEPPLCDPTAGDRQNECWVSVTPYGRFLDEEPSPTSKLTRNLIRRLSLRIGVPPSSTEDDVECSWWNIYFCMQTCALNGVSLSPEEAWYNRSESTAPAFGGRYRPLIVNIDWIRQWLNICLTKHGDQCSRPPKGDNFATGFAAESVPDQSKPADMRLINVVHGCVESFHRKQSSDQQWCPPYVALSYVWGRDQPLKLRRANEEVLSQPGALVRHLPSLTIRDTMELLSRLSWHGVQHLWVDALCIVQDDENDKKRQIGIMGRIYSDAIFTVVAAAGEDAEAGLPGLRAGTRTVTQSKVVMSWPPRPHDFPFDSLNCYGSALAVMNTLNPLPSMSDDYWTSSKYSTRGWTMQERVLSRRNLIFTEEQLYYQCSSTTYCEESHFESHLGRLYPEYPGANGRTILSPSLRETKQSRKESWSTFSGLAHEFSLLEFTNEGDALDGFAGFTQIITQRSGETFIWGLPASFLELGLLWYHLQKDYNLQNPSSVRRRLGKTTLPVSNLRLSLRLPSWDWLGWHGPIYFQAVVENGALAIPEIRCYVHREEGNVIVAVSEDANRHTWPATSLESPFRTRWEGCQDRLVTPQHVKMQLPDLYDQLPTVPENLLLFFWTSAASLRVCFEDGIFKILSPRQLSHHDGPLVGPLIDGEQYTWVGSLLAHPDWNWNGSLRRRHAPRPVEDFIVVGRSPADSISTLIVMCIAFRESVAMRCGLGTISEEAWVASRPQWELVALG